MGYNSVFGRPIFQYKFQTSKVQQVCIIDFVKKILYQTPEIDFPQVFDHEV